MRRRRHQQKVVCAPAQPPAGDLAGDAGQCRGPKSLGERVHAQRFGADDLLPPFLSRPGLAAPPAVDGGGSHAHQFGQVGLGQAEAGAEVLDAVGVVGWYEESHLTRNVLTQIRSRVHSSGWTSRQSYQPLSERIVTASTTSQHRPIPSLLQISNTRQRHRGRMPSLCHCLPLLQQPVPDHTSHLLY